MTHDLTQHFKSVIDDDKRFIIDVVKRTITNPTEKDHVVQFDHKSERIGFIMDRYVEGHDMSQCGRIEIHYNNIDKKTRAENKDCYIANDLCVTENDPSKVTFSWLVNREATQLFGKLYFLVNFVCVNEGEITYSWHTDIFKELQVSEGMNNTESGVSEYPDILESWKQNVLDSVNLEGYATEDYVNQQIEANKQDLSSFATKGEIPDVSNFATKDEIPSTEGLASEAFVEEKINAIPKVDLTPYVKKTELPSLDGYATETFVNERIEKNTHYVSDVSYVDKQVQLSITDDIMDGDIILFRTPSGSLNVHSIVINGEQYSLVDGRKRSVLAAAGFFGGGSIIGVSLDITNKCLYILNVALTHVGDSVVTNFNLTENATTNDAFDAVYALIQDIQKQLSEVAPPTN